MRHYNYLNRSICSLFLFLGLVNCSPENKNSSEPMSQGHWAIIEPQFIRQGQEPIKFSLADEKYKSFTTSDRIVFGEFNRMPPNAKLHVKSTCYLSDDSNQVHEFEEPMRKTYYIYELMKPELLVQSPETPEKLRCSIEFLAKNSSGDTHKFKFKLVDIVTDNNFGELEISHQGRPMTYISNYLPSVSHAQIGEYSLPQPSKPSTDLMILCGGTRGIHLSGARKYTLDEFKFEVNKGQETEFHQDQLCRTLEIEGSARVIKMSRLFVISKKQIDPEATDTTSTIQEVRIPRGGPFTYAKIEIKNPHPLELPVVVDTSHMKTTQITLVVQVNKNVGYGHTSLAPTRYSYYGLKTQNLEDQKLVTLRPYGNARIELAVRIANPNCGSYYPNSVVYAHTPEQYISVRPVLSIDGKLKVKYLGGETRIRLIQRSAGSNHNVGPNYVTDVYDLLSKIIVTEIKPSMCKPITD